MRPARRLGRTTRASAASGVAGVALAAACSTARADTWWSSVAQYRSDIVYQSVQQMTMVAIAGVLAIVVAVPVGIYLSRPSQRHPAAVVMQMLNVGQAIPKLALLALAMSVLGIGTMPAIFALWVATLLPIALNTYEGLRAVPRTLIEAATGMGMTPLQILWRVELPNALYVIFAGIRTALAITVGTAPLAFLVGGGGLGELIFTGIDLNDFTMLLAGAIPTALLAILTDAFVGQMQRRLVSRGINPKSEPLAKGHQPVEETMKNSYFMRLFALLGVLIASLWVIPAQAATIVVGGKNFTEQQLMAEMTTQLLEAKGFTVVKKDGMGSAVLRQAQENGQIDVYWEYTGTSLITYNKVTARLSPDETYKRVKQLDAAKGLVWLNPSRANNTYAFAMNRDEAKKLGIVTLSDLAKAIRGGKVLTFACNSEFYARPDGLHPLEKTYGFEFSQDEVKRMDSGLTYQALKDRQVDIALVFATDGRVPAFNFVILKDDKGFFPAYALTPVIRKAVLDANPSLGPILNALSAKLDEATMARLNASVDVSKKSFSEVSREFLKQSGLI